MNNIDQILNKALKKKMLTLLSGTICHLISENSPENDPGQHKYR